MSWTARAFDEWYLLVYPHRDEAEGRRLIRLLSREVNLRGASVIDLGCGPGRHLPALEEAGSRPLGLDRSESLLREASRRLQETGTKVSRLVRGDWRSLPFSSRAFDGAASLFTSFGYFSEDEDRGVLAESARVLRPGGFFLLDYLNRDRVLVERDGSKERAQGEHIIRERKDVLENDRVVVKRVTISRSDTGALVADYEERVTLYTAKELHQLLEQAGFRVHRLFGDYDGAAYDAKTSSRAILLGIRESACA